MDKSRELDEKIKDLIETEAPSKAPLPSSVEEDDFENIDMIDEYENVVKRLREHLVIKDRFYKMRMFSRCFVGSEAVDFLAEDQLLEREEVYCTLYLAVFYYCLFLSCCFTIIKIKSNCIGVDSYGRN